MAYKSAAKRLSITASRLGTTVATVRRAYSATDRDTGLTVTNLLLDGLHADGATSLSLKAPDSGALRGTVPKSLVLTIDGDDYVVASEASAVATTNRIAVTVSPGLDGAQADETVVSLADFKSWTHTGVKFRPASSAEIAYGTAYGTDLKYMAAFPGHSAPEPVQERDVVTFALQDGRSFVATIITKNPRAWGQEVFCA